MAKNKIPCCLSIFRNLHPIILIMIRFAFFVLLIFSTFPLIAQPGLDYAGEIRRWDSQRVANLKAENGWLNLAGLLFLPKGTSSFGSGKQATVKFPAGTIDELAGTFVVSDSAVNIITNKEIVVTVNGRSTHQATIFHKDSTSSPEVRYGNLKWNIIERDGKFAIRLRNLQSDAVKNFKGIERYIIDSAWRVKAVMRENIIPVMIPITNILGNTSNQPSPGKLFFTINGKQYSLDALDGGKDELFIIFGDETNGLQTYPSGRYVYIKRPGANGITWIDFNKAYNPPCAFTDYATCPLPPKQNILTLSVTAGEKNYGHH
jgi:uncharacterized protein